MAKSARRRPKGSGTVFQRGGKGNWILEYTDEDGQRRTSSSRTRDRALALRMLSKKVEEVEQVRSGLLDREALAQRSAGREEIGEYVEAYVASCTAQGHSARALKQKRKTLLRFLEAETVRKIGGLTTARLDHYLTGMSEAGKAAATCNRHRSQVIAFSRWLHRMGHAPDLKLERIPKRNESRDRRLERRPLTDEEVERLFRVAKAKGAACELYYGLALFAGLRRGEMKRLLWRDIDLETLNLHILGGKGRAVDALPIHPMLAKLIEAHKGTEEPPGDRPVLRPFQTNQTRLRDYEKAGLVRSLPVLDEKGSPILNSRGRPRVRYVPADGGEKEVDLHSLRVTFATRLARSSMPMMLVKKLMRHSTFSVTEQHYIHLEMDEARRALEAVPLGTQEEQALDAAPVRTDGSAGPSQGSAGSSGDRRSTDGAVGAPSDPGAAEGRTGGAQSIQQFEGDALLADWEGEDNRRSGAQERSIEAQVLIESFRSLSPTLDRLLSERAQEDVRTGAPGLDDCGVLLKRGAGGYGKRGIRTTNSLCDSLRRLRSLLLCASDEALEEVAAALLREE